MDTGGTTLVERISDIIEEVVGLRPSPEAIRNCDSRLDELGVSSLFLYPFIAALEKAFAVVFEDADIDRRNFLSVGRITELLSRYGVPSWTGIN